MQTQESVRTIGELIKGIEIAMLTTLDAGGNLRSRPMMTQAMEFGGDLWFITRLSSPKVAELHGDDRVNVSFSSPHEFRFVSVSGRGAIVQDKSLIRRFWKPGYERFIPEGPDADDIALLCIHANQAEYWDQETNRFVQLATEPGPTIPV